MSQIILIQAAPTQWDVEDRLGGNHPLPLMELALAGIEQVVRSLPAGVTAVYRPKQNEACNQVAKIAATRFKLKPGDNAALDEVNLGLWQGLTRAELRFRHPTVFPQWEQNPMSVNPPDGETFLQAVERVRHALQRILRRRRGVTVLLAVRPMVMQIALGLLKDEPLETIAKRLQNCSPIETIGLNYEQLRRFIG